MTCRRGGIRVRPAARDAPTRSGSDPGADAVNTVVLPAGYEPKPKPEPTNQSPAATAATRPQVPPPTAPVSAHAQVPPRASLSDRKLWIVSGSAVAFLVVAVAAILWLRSAPPGEDAVSPAPAGAELHKPDRSVPSSSHRQRCRVTIRTRRRTRSPVHRTAMPRATLRRQGLASILLAASNRLPQRFRPPATARAGLYLSRRATAGREWQRLIDAASKVEIVAIANPNSGPGSERNLEYAAVFTEASEQGVTLVGYVSTDYGKRPQAEITKDVDSWIRFYPQIRGFFFDQQPRESHGAAHFAELRDYVKRKISKILW